MNRRVACLLGSICALALALPVPSFAQSNDNDYTPLNSRIRRDRQFQLEPPPHIVTPEKMSKVSRDQSRSMLNQFGKCLYNRSKADSLDLLDKTDFGFRDFQQIGLATQKAARIYGFDDCLGRVASLNQSGVVLRYSAPGLRQWLLQAAYLDRYPKGATWIQPGAVVEDRVFPLSKDDAGVKAAMDFADCVVAKDPYGADFFYRTTGGTPEETEAANALGPSLGPCLPQGMQIQLDQQTLRTWLGEALWYASNHSALPRPGAVPAAH